MKTMQSFVVRGRPVGYYAEGRSPNWTRKEAYTRYKMLVQALALANGINCPLTATKNRPVSIHTVAYFVNGTHCDPGNVQKGICDALFYRTKEQRRRIGNGGDKYTGGSFVPPRYDAHDPRVEITIEWDCGPIW